VLEKVLAPLHVARARGARKGIGAAARRGGRHAYEKTPNDLLRTQFLSLDPLAKVRHAYEKTPNDLLRTQFLSLKRTVKVRHAYEKTPNHQFRTQFLSLKPTVKVWHAYEKTPKDQFRTQFLSLKPTVKVWHAYEETPKDLFRTQFLSLKPTVKVPVCVVVLATDACARGAALESVLGWGQNEVHPKVEKKVSHHDVDKCSLRERFLKPNRSTCSGKLPPKKSNDRIQAVYPPLPGSRGARKGIGARCIGINALTR